MHPFKDNPGCQDIEGSRTFLTVSADPPTSVTCAQGEKSKSANLNMLWPIRLRGAGL